MKILVINAGSSSLKYQLIDIAGEKEEVLASGSVTRIGLENSVFEHKVNGEKYKETKAIIANHDEAIALVLEALTDAERGGAIASLDEIDACGHRVLHGGEIFKASVLVTPEAMKEIEDLIPLGPLHQKANIAGIRACEKAMPGKPNVAVFDTAFHQTMEPKAFLYGIPYKYYENLKVRRYGFHGTSHRYIASEAPKLLGKKPEETNLIICHLGNGSSLSAIKNGKVVDTTMGLTPLEGLLMGTRSGDLDPAVLQFIMEREGLDIKQMLDILNKKSGFEGVSGVSSDMRDVQNAAAEGNKLARTSVEMWVYRVQKYIGAYNVAVGGADAIVFTAGIGENDCPAAQEIIDGLAFMGVKIDPEKNKRGVCSVISTDDSSIAVIRMPTNEEVMIARDTLALTAK